MSVLDGVQYSIHSDTVGRTPLVRLRAVTAAARPPCSRSSRPCNPGSSVKDPDRSRDGEAAEREGKLAPGGTIVE